MATASNHQGRSDGRRFTIGSVAGIVGALLGMVGNLLHPPIPSGDPEGVARTIADSDIWVGGVRWAAYRPPRTVQGHAQTRGGGTRRPSTPSRASYSVRVDSSRRAGRGGR